MENKMFLTTLSLIAALSLGALFSMTALPAYADTAVIASVAGDAKIDAAATRTGMPR